MMNNKKRGNVCKIIAYSQNDIINKLNKSHKHWLRNKRRLVFVNYLIIVKSGKNVNFIEKTLNHNKKFFRDSVKINIICASQKITY